jgi:hypothetical protein
MQPAITENAAMSLKAFHIVFIAVSTIGSFLFGFWAVREWRATGETYALLMGIVSFALLFALIPYAFWFLRKLKNESYL